MKAYHYLLGKKQISTSIDEIIPDKFSKENFLLVKDYTNSLKSEILNRYKEEEYKDIIQISEETFKVLAPYLDVVKRGEKLLTEIEDKTPGYKKYDDKKIVVDLKKFFKDYKNAKLVNVQIIGEYLTVDAELEYKSEEENLAFRRNDAKQQIYDLKVSLETKLEKEGHKTTPLAIQGIDVQPEKARFEINSMLLSHGREGVELYVENKKTQAIIHHLEQLTNCKVVLK